MANVSDVAARDGVHELVLIPLNDPSAARRVPVINKGYFGYDGLIPGPNGSVVGISHNPAKKGSTLVQIASDDDWKTAKVIAIKSIRRSTTVAAAGDGTYFVLNQDFKTPNTPTWTL